MAGDIRPVKQRLIHSSADADLLISSVTASTNQTIQSLAEVGTSGLQALWRLKVHPIGCDPLNSESPLNFIEQINQSFTYIASARAARILLTLHPELAPLRLNLGTMGGSDIESVAVDGLAAEVFAAVSTSSNRKLFKDLTKVSACNARHKYVFFMCPGYREGRQPELERNGVQVWSVGDSL